MDENETDEEVMEILPLKHTRWSVLVLGVTYVAGIARETADALATLSMLTAQHNLHKREQDKFYEVVKDG